MKKQSYTTKLQAGLGLIPETQRLLDLWEPGMDTRALLQTALSSGEFPTITARRLRNIVSEGFAPRYLVNDAGPAKLLQNLNGNVTSQDQKQLFFLFTYRANKILADFVREVYWTRYAAGSFSVSKEDAVEFVEAAVQNGKTTTPWSESTIRRVSSYLLGACADFGMVGPIKGRARSIQPFRPTPFISSFLAHDLHFKGYADNAVLNHEDWALFGLDPDDVLAELKQIALRGELILQSAGGVVQIAWKNKNIEELANGFTDS